MFKDGSLALKKKKRFEDSVSQRLSATAPTKDAKKDED